MGLSLHVVTRLEMLRAPLATALREAIGADVEAGREVRVVLLHDAVTRAAWVAAVPGVAGVHPRLDDCRRRGIDPPPTALDDAAIVARLAAAGRVASW